MNQSTALPVAPNERTIIIDVLRGFALFGVIIANLEGFITFALPDAQVQLMTNTRMDKFTENFLLLFVDNKFITIFSILFGYGFGVVIERVAAKGMNVNRFFTRRMLLLLLFSLIHLAFWWGEILNVYASCGLLLLLFRKASNKNLLIWAAVFLFICTPIVQALKIYLLPQNPPELDILLTDYVNSMKGRNILSIAQYNYKALWYIFFERWSQYRDMFEVLAKFLLGYYILRMGWLKSMQGSISYFKKAWKMILPVALIYLAGQAAFNIFGVKINDNAIKIAVFTFNRAGILSLSLIYCISIILLYHQNKNIKLFRAFRWVGMMSLTNYLTQTIFYVFLFYGLGLGMLGKIHLQWVIPVGIVFYSLQSLSSKYWMSNYNYGPAEWIWRQLTYGKRFPIKKQAQQRS